MGPIGQGVKTLNGVDYIIRLCAERSVSGALEPKPEVEIWRRPVFPTQRPRLVLRSKVGQSTQLLPV